RGRNSLLTSLPVVNQGPIPISKEKKKDLLDLLPLIDSAVHDFYKNLPVDNVPASDPDLEEYDADRRKKVFQKNLLKFCQRKLRFQCFGTKEHRDDDVIDLEHGFEGIFICCNARFKYFESYLEKCCAREEYLFVVTHDLSAEVLLVQSLA
ncbi:hypothetical protein L9F63_007899, partial [Diploptera punctata]